MYAINGSGLDCMLNPNYSAKHKLKFVLSFIAAIFLMNKHASNSLDCFFATMATATITVWYVMC